MDIVWTVIAYVTSPFEVMIVDLSAECPQNCNNRGLCVEGRCYCALGFSSDSCIPIAEIAREMSSHVSPEPEQVMDPDTNRTFGTVGAIFVGGRRAWCCHARDIEVRS